MGPLLETRIWVLNAQYWESTGRSVRPESVEVRVGRAPVCADSEEPRVDGRDGESVEQKGTKITKIGQV